MTTHRITFDGGAAPNPGKGYGSYLIERLADRKKKMGRVAFGDEPMTNNEAEYRTLLAAVSHLSRLEGQTWDATVEIVGDSQLVLNQIAGKWQINHDHLRALADQVCHLLGHYASWSTRWEKRDAIVAIFGH